jgi:glutamate carboxypeptidase
MSLLSAESWIASQHSQALLLLEEFCAINSHTKNLEGLSTMRMRLIEAFSTLGGLTEEIPCLRNGEPLGSIITIEKRPEAPLQVLLGGHMDTVHTKDSPFQNCVNEEKRLIGPGCADMKGGLVTLLYALTAFEKIQKNQRLGWKVVINADEEIGSPGSRPFWRKLAPAYDFGLLYEPSYADGAFVDARKGSMNVLLEVQGRSSHAGRDFSMGRSANLGIVKFLNALFEAGAYYPELTINVGALHGGTAANVVPEKAYARINLRSFHEKDLASINRDMEEIQVQISKREDVSFRQTIESSTAPKSVTPELHLLFKAVETSANELNMPFALRSSGGVCDGNALMEAGLVNIDTMGVVGGKMHTDEEFMEKQSLTDRAKLTLHLLWNYSEGKIPQLVRNR